MAAQGPTIHTSQPNSGIPLGRVLAGVDSGGFPGGIPGPGGRGTLKVMDGSWKIISGITFATQGIKFLAFGPWVLIP